MKTSPLASLILSVSHRLVPLFLIAGFPMACVAAETNSITVPMDMEMVKRNQYFGYKPEEIQKYFSAPRMIEYDTEGADWGRIGKPPSPGVHPRVLFNQEDIPAIKKRLESKPGKQIAAALRKTVEDAITGQNAKYSKEYQELIAGNTNVPIHTECIPVAYAVLNESFRCLIDGDVEGGAKAAAAVTTIAAIDKRILDETREKIRTKTAGQVDDFEQVGQLQTQQGTLGLMYDFTHNWMTPAQRDAVRSVISEASAGMRFVGADSLRVQSTCSSNHIPWIARLIYLPASIEGESGYDPGTFERCADAMRWFYNIGIYRDGDAYEGWGKNFFRAEIPFILARHGDKTFSTVNVRNAWRNYFIHALEPWGGGWTFYDSNGGTGNKMYDQPDILIYKAFFPNDRTIDFVYRNHISSDYKEFGAPVNLSHPFMAADGILTALFVNGYDENKNWQSAHDECTQAMPPDYWSEDTGNLIARSSWDPSALYLSYMNRSNLGGHLYCDRGHFSIYSNGRTWGVYKPMRQVPEAYQPKNRTGVMVDGDGVSAVPGKCVAHAVTTDASFVATDLKPSYDFICNYIFPNKERKNTVRLPFTPNDFRLIKSPYPWMDIGQDEMPNWLNSRIPSPPPGQPIPPNPAPGAFWRAQPVPYAHAFRTAGLVRGKHPYVLVIDDIKRDEKEHDFAWGMTLADDVDLQAAIPGSDPTSCVLVERGKSPAQTRSLLVRMLDVKGFVGVPAIEQVSSKNPPMKDVITPKLVFHARATEPNFKTILFGYRSGEALPVTEWNDDRTRLTICWPDQKDVITFDKSPDHRTRFSVNRNGSELLRL